MKEAYTVVILRAKMGARHRFAGVYPAGQIEDMKKSLGKFYDITDAGTWDDLDDALGAAESRNDAFRQDRTLAKEYR